MLFRSLDGAGASSDRSQTAKKTSTQWWAWLIPHVKPTGPRREPFHRWTGLPGKTQGFPLMAQHTFRCMATWMTVMHSSDLCCCLGVQNGGYAAPRALRARY